MVANSSLIELKVYSARRCSCLVIETSSHIWEIMCLRREPISATLLNQNNASLHSHCPQISAAPTSHQGSFSLQQMDTITESHTDQMQRTTNHVVTSPRWCIFNTILTPIVQETSWKQGEKEYEDQRTGKSAVRMCLLEIKEKVYSWYPGKTTETETEQWQYQQTW